MRWSNTYVTPYKDTETHSKIKDSEICSLFHDITEFFDYSAKYSARWFSKLYVPIGTKTQTDHYELSFATEPVT